jgi:biopolymer transport protein ExbD
MLRNRRRRDQNLPSFDMTPMIDCVFQLLIFFIVCTRFKQEERRFEPHLSTSEGLASHNPPPQEQLTIYCQWDDSTQQGQFAIGISARGRKAVAGSNVALTELLPLDRDGHSEVSRKHEIYKRVHAALIEACKAYVANSGARIDKIEISFAKDAAVGARSGTAPWAYVSLAIDAANAINVGRKKSGEPAYNLTFKFVDALDGFGR